MGAFLKFILLVGLVGATAFGVYVSLHLDKFFPKEQEVEEEAPKPAPAPKPVPVEIEEVKEEPAPPPEPPPPPKKTVAELKAEADAAQREIDAKIAARQAENAKPLSGFAGITFGEVLNATPIRMEEVPEGGYAAVVLGPAAKKAFLAFKERPLVWVTPKTHRIYRIQFTTYLPSAAVDAPSAVTTNVVAQLAQKMRRDPLFVDPIKFPLARREYVFPFAATTLMLRENGGAKLDLVVEHAGIRAEVKSESEALLKEEAAEPAKAKTLSSDKYPNGGKAPGKRRNVKDGTPRAFCGVAFGTLPPYAAVMSNPVKGDKGFFLDYRRAKCAPFMGFDHGRANVSRTTGGVIAVLLYSEGPVDGLSEREYFDRVRQAIERHYKLKGPSAQKGSADFPDLTYTVGDVDISFGPDPRGGFYLKAIHNKLSLY